MRLALFEYPASSGEHVGLVTDAGIAAVDRVSTSHERPTLTHVIERFDELREELEQIERSAPTVSIADATLLPPLARPAKILCCMRAQRDVRDANSDLHLFLKSTTSIIGPGDEVILPDLEGAAVFTHNVAVAIVVGRLTREVSSADWRCAVFGYTAFIDITARTNSHARWKDGKSCLGASCDTFGPLGPWIVPSGDLDTEEGLTIRMRSGSELRQEYRLLDLDKHVGEIVALASSVMTLRPGDIIAVGGPASGQGPIQDGEHLTAELEQVGSLAVGVSDPLRRRWDPGLRISVDRDDVDVSSLVR
jgi:2-keto-4-pentenoate hydratase/2-oxohepta-3-ene-1,7-dioic acid hydratase in catechol pathway